MVSLIVDNVYLEYGVVYEYVSIVGVRCYVLEKIVEFCGCFGFIVKIFEVFVVDDSVFVENCGWFMVLSSVIVIMFYFEFCNICDIKLENIG